MCSVLTCYLTYCAKSTCIMSFVITDVDCIVLKRL